METIRSDEKLPWQQPTVTLVGTISLLVRGGSAQGKQPGSHDGDADQFFNPRNG